MNTSVQKKPLHAYALLCVVLLFLPKINLLTIENETAGLRIDDFILTGLAILLGAVFARNQKECNKIEILISGIVALSLISFLINQTLILSGILHVRASLFYCVRLIEYFLFFYVGKMARTHLSLRAIVACFLSLNTILMILQKWELLGTMRHLGSLTFDSSRVAGLSSFPAEMGGLLNMIFCYLLIDQPSKKSSPYHRGIWLQSRDLWIFLFFLVLTALTGARIAVATTLLLFMAYVIITYRKSFFQLLTGTLVFAILLAPIATLIILNTESLSARSQGLLSWSNLSLVGNVWDRIDLDAELYDALDYHFGDYDMSWWLRIHKWCYALKTYISHPVCYLQGIGPGAFSAAVDGGFVRILAEGGIIGSLLYFLLFREISKTSRILKWLVACFLLNMLFFDIYLAYKTMTFLFLVLGFETATAANTKKIL